MNWMLNKISQYGDRTMIIGERQTASYDELYTQICVWQRRISEFGIKQGDVVAIVGDFDSESAALIMCLLANNNIVVPLTVETLAKHEQFFEMASVSFCLQCDASTRQWHCSNLSPKEMHPLIEQLKSPPDAGLVLFTSGSTGESKGAVLRASSLLDKYLRPNTKPLKPMRCVVFLKLDHIGGLNTFFSILFSGGTAILINDRSAENVCQTIEKHRAELLPTTPTFLNMMLISGVMQKCDMSSLKVITYGTEPMPRSTLKAVNEQFPAVKLKQTYGLTELGIFSTRSKRSSSDWLEIGGEGVETRVTDGVLEIKTPARMLGYLNAESPFTEDGFYITGDRVEVDGKYFRILGRDSEIINVGGEKVYPAEVENVLLQMPNVKEAIVRGKSSPVVGNIVCASLVLSKNESRTELINRVSAFCKSRLEAYKVPKIVMISKESFMSARLKTSRR